MNRKTDFLLTLLTFTCLSQFSGLGADAFAQTSEGAGESFMQRQNMHIHSQFKYSEIRVTQQQKEEWSANLFNEDNSLSMRVENIDSLKLSKDDLQNNDSQNNILNNGVELLEF